jgi:hypothetical protein
MVLIRIWRDASTATKAKVSKIIRREAVCLLLNIFDLPLQA